jgi:Flp pilus assembly protein TadD
MGYALATRGRLAEGLAHMMRGADLEPLTPMWTSNAGLICRWMRDDAAAQEQLRRSLDVDPRFLLSRIELGRTHAAAGRVAEAMREFEQAERDSGGHPHATGHVGYANALLGRRADAERCLARLGEMSSQRYVPPSAQAMVHLGLGDRDRVFECLDRAAEDREARMIHLKVDPLYDPLRTDRRFEALLHRAGLSR